MATNGKTHDPTASKETVFVCPGDEAQGVFLAGSFNDRAPTRTRMVRQDDGSWQAELELASGRYEYKFIVDGTWCCEPGRTDSDGADYVPNPFGTMNRVIEVPVAAKSEGGRRCLKMKFLTVVPPICNIACGRPPLVSQCEL
ncbi:MAG: glycogen-binding domain-containing protein [Acidobacteriota bacterium]